MSYDPRKNYIIAAVATLCGDGTTESIEELSKTLHDRPELDGFLDDPSIKMLQAITTRTEDASGVGAVELRNELNTSPLAKGQHEIHFLKIRPDVITPQTLASNILVSSVVRSPLLSLYHTLHQVYAPTLLGSSSWAGTLDSSLQACLTKLEDGLGSIVRRGDDAAGAGGDKSAEDAYANIHEPSDEFLHWREVARRGGRNRDRGQRLHDAFASIAERFNNLEDRSMSELVELVEDTQNVLDDVWRLEVSSGEPYPQGRMTRLLSVIGGALGRRVQHLLSATDLWQGSFSTVRNALRDGSSVLDRWLTAVKQLTGTFWTTEEHAWVGEPFTDDFVTSLAARMDEISRLRTTHEELLRLLSPEDRRQLRVDDTFKPFARLQPLHVNSYTQPAWQAAVQAYERRLQPIESHIAGDLRRQIGAMGDRPQQLLREFGRYRNILRRPAVARQLAAERETLLAQLSAHVEAVEGDFEAFSAGVGGLGGGGGMGMGMGGGGASGAGRQGRNLSPAVNAVVWAQALRSKVAGILHNSTSLLGDLPAFRDFKAMSRELVDKLSLFEKEQCQEWVTATQERLRDGQLSLEMTGQVMDFDLDGNMVVNYSEDLVILLREVRQLSELGVTVPDRIRRAAGDAEKYYRYGVMLKKVANFYNTMEGQILPTQKSMLYDALASFENVVKNPTGRTSRGQRGGAVTWSNPQECQEYVERLQRAADRASSENRRLRKVHQRLASEVVSLMNVDLLRQRDVWKQKWSAMQDIKRDLSRTYTDERMARWLLHWDHQLYKALEVGYRMGLESLNENLAEMKCELTLGKGRIVFRPPLEELRASYYREMKKFISIPTSFAGLGDNKAVFEAMANRNAESLVAVYRKAEILFARLGKLRDTYGEWAALSGVDLEAYVESNVTAVADWDINFKMLKMRRKEAERLPDFSKVDCINVSMVPFKAAIEGLMQTLSDVLVLSLRKALNTHLGNVEQFLEHAMERLNERPSTIDEIGKAKREWQEINETKSSIRQEYRLCEEQKRLLLSMAGANIDLSDVTTRLMRLPDDWDTFEVALEAFNDMIEEARTKMRDGVEEEVMAVNVSLDKFAQRWHALKPKEVKTWSPEEVAAVHEAIAGWKVQLDEIKGRADTLVANCESFMMPRPKFQGLEELEADFDYVEASWGMYKEYTEDTDAVAGQDWITFRGHLYDLSDIAHKWLDRVAGKTRDVVCRRIHEQADVLRRAVPSLKYATGEPFKEEHWGQVFRKLGMPKGVRLDTLTVGHFLGVMPAVAENLQFLKGLTSRAQGEVSIREALQDLRAWGETAEFSLMDHECQGRTCNLICEWKDLFKDVGDHQSLLQSLKESQYFKPFADQATQFEAKLALLDECCQHLNGIQRKWVYLEPIFGRGALPTEQARFRRVDDEFRDIMSKVSMDKKVFNIADAAIFPGLRDTLATMLDQLERCQKALADFLEEKRSKLPRFYFIGDDDLLEILGQSKNPAVIQAHLKKLFQGIHHVEFSDDKATITAMCSVHGEVVPLSSPVTIVDDVEVWLDALCKEMVTTLSKSLVQCLRSEADLRTFPSQVLCLSENIHFTELCERAIASGDLAGLRRRLEGQLQAYTTQDLSSERLLQLKVKALVLDLIHNMDVVDQLTRESCSSTSQWTWQRQLRYYLKDGMCVARMCEAECQYTYEYQGNASKLVHTPLTDKCYLTLTQGMAMGMGGNPYGPAGTGKTESVKALGAALGRQVLVFNCDEGIDFHSMGRIFTGLVKCGAWGCFDEFNRLKADQLSAVSQQIQVIQAAIKERQPSVVLLGTTIDVDFNAGIFVTMNPAGKGYGGRSKLPDNLKQLFRPVAMSRPDNELIAEVILYSEGFKYAKILGKKMVSLFTLCKQLLTPQQHYDWGLRAMKTCLNTGGNLIQQAKVKGLELTEVTEQEMLIKAVRVNTLSKLTFDDCQRFLSLVGDVFPGINSQDISYEELEAAIREVLSNKPFNLMYDEVQVRKMLQLKESLDQRMGCVIVGPSGCGKSTLWRVLQAAMIKTGQLVVTHVMNPKSMPRERLLGEMDPDTREWTDGVLTAAARQVVKEPMTTRSWVVCDGDVDPEWIESLNSVLDDNHLLTLPNGERISFGANVNFLFETHDLRFASPATISRMGMIYLSDEDVDVKRVVKRWIKQQPEADQLTLSSWMEDLFYRALDHVLQAGDFVVDTTMVGTVMNGLSHVAGSKSQGEFVCGLIRGLGGNLDMEQRTAFAREVFAWVGERPPDSNAPLDCSYDGGFKSFPQSKNDAGMTRDDLEAGAVVRTVSVQRTLKMIEAWVSNMEPFILVGPEGCGKTMLINHVISQRRNTSVTVLHCNAQTTAGHVIQRIRQACLLYSTNAGRVYRPREGDRLVLFLKDINLPRPDKYDTCLLVAFLQQLVTFNGFYDENLEFLGIERVHIVATMNPATTVGRHHLSTRFTAIVRIAYMDYPTPQELGIIYSCYLRAAFNGVSLGEDRFRSPDALTKLATSMVELFQQVRNKFSIDDHRHYLFTPRDITEWVHGLLRYNVTEESMCDVVAYEAQRLFRDRLVNPDACNKFDSMLSAVFSSHWRARLDLADSVFTTLGVGVAPSGGESKGQEGESKGVDAPAAAARGRSALTRLSMSDFQTVVQQGVRMYEREEQQLHLLLFDETLHHIVRLDRLLSEPGGSVLLVGRTGVGRRNATALVAHMHGVRFYSPSITREYGMRQFFVDVKQVLQVAGVEGADVCLYLEDYQFTEGSILETVNSLLSSGEVPGLYTHEELEPLLAPLKEEMGEEGFQYKTPYDFFVSRVRRHLHVIVAMDPSHPKFLVRCESNPALYARCTILWMGEWTRSSMRAVPGMIVPNIMREDENANQTVDQLISIHESCKPRGATPRDYVQFLEQYQRLHDWKHGGVASDAERLEAGLQKLLDAAETVDALSQEANEARVQLREKQAAADEAMDEITRALELASSRRKEVEDLTEKAVVAEKATMGRKGEILEQLEGITPVLEAAKKAVGSIRSDHLAEIRSLSMPPEPIVDVLSAVLRLLGIQDTSWLSMKKFLGNRGVKEEILAFDARRITNSMRKGVLKILKSKGSSFDHATIKRVSRAAAPLAAWVKANIQYSLVLERIQPLEAQLAEATDNLDRTQHQLTKLQDELQELDDSVTRLKKDFGRRTAEAEALKIQLQKTEQTLERAEALLGKLSGEKDRWAHEVKNLRRQMATLPRQAMMAAGFVTFLAKSPEDVRASALREWASLVGLRDFEFMRFASTESQLLTWKAGGLPADALSMENALVILNPGQRCPFIIDPSQTATTWLKSHLAQDKIRPLEVVTAQDPRLTTHVELAVRFGKSLMVAEVDGVEPMLVPLIRKDLANQGPRQVVRIGDKVVDYNDNFRLFMVTRNPSPDISPDMASLISEVNFTVTRSGLESQLLGVTIKHEQPELEKQKSALLAKEEELKVQLATLEKQLLVALASSTGDILDNQELIETLTATKAKSADIAHSLEESAKASGELDNQRDVYRPFASAGSRLFFLVRGLQSTNHMYQFSLQSFTNLFEATLEDAMENTAAEDRIRRLSPALERRVLFFVGRSLFKADRLMWGLHLVRGMHPEMFEDNEFDFFVGDLVTGMDSPKRVTLPRWAGQDRASAFKSLQSNFPHLVNSLGLDAGDSWARWAASETPEVSFPSSARSLSDFQQVMVVQVFRPDRLVTALSTFVCQALNVQSVAPPPSDLAKLYEQETDPTTPVLMITTTGADPSKDLADCAARIVGRTKYAELAMGGGQQATALSMLREAALGGGWLLLKNLHLVVSWLPTLEKELNSLKPHRDFRLWLTTESHDAFTPILLQQALKVTFEAPPGLKKNLQRTFTAWDADVFASGSTQRAQVMFLLAWFHAIVQERRTYVPQGWTKAYEFSFADLRAGATVVDEVLASSGSSGGVSWEFIHGLFESAIYGGRVDNSFDGRVLTCYLRRFFTSEMLSGRATLGAGLSVPQTKSYGEYLSIIDSLPDQDAPELFGLPQNIQRSVQRAQSKHVIKQLKALQVLDAAAAGFDREQWRTQLGPLLEMWSRLTSGSGAAALDTRGPDAMAKAADLATRPPVTQFVVMELRMASRLVSSVNHQLQDLKKVVYGSGLLTPAIQETAKALLSNQLPSAWERKWEGPPSPKAWLAAVVVRRIALSTWAQEAMSERLLGRELVLSELFQPAVFLNALRQQTARAAGVPIDGLKLTSGFGTSLRGAPLPVTIAGLALQGASFEGGALGPCESGARELVELPPLTLAWVPARDADAAASAGNCISAPLYMATAREQLLTEVLLPCRGSSSRWVLAGVATFLSTEQ